MMTGWLGWVLAGIVAVTGTAIWTRRTRIRLSDRAELPVGVIWEHYYREKGIPLPRMEACYEEIAEACGVPSVGTLRPTDRFAVELRPRAGWEWDNGLSVLSEKFRSRAEKAGIQLESISSVDDYVLAVDRVEREET